MWISCRQSKSGNNVVNLWMSYGQCVDTLCVQATVSPNIMFTMFPDSTHVSHFVYTFSTLLFACQFFLHAPSHYFHMFSRVYCILINS